MRTKYLLATAALASLFTACSQEEVFDASAPKVDPLAGRPIVGNVEFVSDAPTTRYNSEICAPEEGDAIGLYLMDEFRGWNEGNRQGELDNANETLFKYQSNWWQMYRLTNNIQSNYGYEFVPENKTWINRASQLVEGNYMVMLPKNDVATNRRDLWREIKPVVDLKHHSTREDNYYVNRDNQFMLDYQQIYRDQRKDDEGKLTINVKFRYILTYAKFIIENAAANPFIAEKLVFKAPNGKPLPTVAYVKPEEMRPDVNKWNAPAWIARGLNQQDVDGTIDQALGECDEVLGEGLYDREWFTQEAARGMVQYATTEEQVPYGLTNDAVAYEYTFNFPDEAEGGVRLEGNSTSSDPKKRVLGVSIALPAFDFGEYDWTDMEVVVYGKMWDPKADDMKGAWRYGVLRKLGKDNAEFTLDKLKLWDSSMKEIPTANLAFDDSYFYQEEEIRVETTADLLKLLEARLSATTTTEDVDFNVWPYGKGLEITDEVVAMIENYEKKHGVEVNVHFKNDLAQAAQTPIILKAENCINMFTYGGVNVIVEADQTSKEPVVGIAGLMNKANLTIDADLTASSIVNAEKTGVITVNEATVTATIHNMNKMILNASAEIQGAVRNDREIEVAGGVIVETIINDNDCVDCGEGPATLVVDEAGVLVVSTLENGENGVITNDGTINGMVVLTNKTGGLLTNNGTINSRIENAGVIENYGLITQYKADGERSINTVDGRIINHGTSINPETGKAESDKDAEIRAARDANNSNGMANFENNGYISNFGVFMDVINNGTIEQHKADKAKLYIMKGNGEINVTGCTAGKELTEIAGTLTGQQFLYIVSEDMKSNALAGRNYLYEIRVQNATLNVEKDKDFPMWGELVMNNAAINFAEKYTTPNSVNVEVAGGDNTFKGVGANFTEGTLTVAGLDTHAEILQGCTMKSKKTVVDGDLKCFGMLVTGSMSGLGYYNGKKILQ